VREVAVVDPPQHAFPGAVSVSRETREPWEAAGVSRATWFHQRRNWGLNTLLYSVITD
jgi:hypothetical protein